MAAEDSQSLEHAPTWVVAAVCFFIACISIGMERLLHYLGEFLKNKKQEPLFEALQKVKEELMLLGFISLLLAVFQGLIREICIPEHLSNYMLPCASAREDDDSQKHETCELDYCSKKGLAPLLSLEALHQLHIFIFVLAVVHVVFSATTMVLGGAKIRQWKHWEDSIRHAPSQPVNKPAKVKPDHARPHLTFFRLRAVGYWRNKIGIRWIRVFIKQFYGSLTESDYIAMRLGFIMTHTPSNPDFDFHEYMMRTLEIDFKKIVGISLYLWLFAVVFLLLDVRGWHSYFWLSFLPFVLLLIAGAKLEHVISLLAKEVQEKKTTRLTPGTKPMTPSDEHFWFGRPAILLDLIHFILFQNAFEIAFFFWILTTYGFTSCIMEKIGFIVPRLIIGVIIQVLCSYITFPLYAIVTQMGSMFRQGVLEHTLSIQMELQKNAEQPPVNLEGIATSITERSDSNETRVTSSPRDQ